MALFGVGTLTVFYAGFDRRLTASAPLPGCGDGIKAGVEQCDDGNGVGGDGCTALCGIEAGYTCTNGVTPQFSILSATPNLREIIKGPDNNMWFSNISNAAFVKMDASGAPTSYTPYSTPIGLVAGPDGNVWGVDSSTSVNKLFRITPAGVATPYALPTPAAAPAYLASIGAKVWFTESAVDKIANINPSTGAIQEFPLYTPVLATKVNPHAIVGGPDGNVWVGTLRGTKILKIHPGTGVILQEYPIPGATAPLGAGVSRITVSSDGKLWFSASYLNKIFRMDPSNGSILNTYDAPTSSPAYAPGFLTFASDGNAWFASNNSPPKIGRINVTTGAVTSFNLASTLGYTYDSAVAADGSLWITTATSVVRMTFPSICTNGTATSSSSVAASAICGNGTLSFPAEECDDHNTVSGDGCSATCVMEVGYSCPTAGQLCTTACGDGVTVGSEQCDDNNKVSGDGCSSTCRTETGYACTNNLTVDMMSEEHYPGFESSSLCLPICGNGVRSPGEQCDDGNTNLDDGCFPGECRIEAGYSCSGTSCSRICGDGILLAPEQCDDGNTTAGDGCSASCQSEANFTCTGNTVQKRPDLSLTPVDLIPMLDAPHVPFMANVPPGSTIKLTLSGGLLSTVSNNVLFACQNFMVVVTSEYLPGQFDQLSEGMSLPDDLYDSSLTQIPLSNFVGGAKVSDGGIAPLFLYLNDADQARARDMIGNLRGRCVLSAITVTPPTVSYACSEKAVCGNGRKQGTEQCDDGNQSNTDSCTNTCTTPVCGDNYKQPNEECDDGNAVDTDSCTNTCKNAKCGDGIKMATEECDDGNTNDADACTNACKTAKCGDGHVQTGEGCDDGNTNDADACTNACKVAGCGDGIKSATEECDDGNQENADACTNTCKNAKCGDSIVGNTETCDDGNATAGDGCSASCKEEEGFSCGSNKCTTICGDGKMKGGEQCDDGNSTGNDGCDGVCRTESGYVCAGTPSTCARNAVTTTTVVSPATTVSAPRPATVSSAPKTVTTPLPTPPVAPVVPTTPVAVQPTSTCPANGCTDATRGYCAQTGASCVSTAAYPCFICLPAQQQAQSSVSQQRQPTAIGQQPPPPLNPAAPAEPTAVVPIGGLPLVTDALYRLPVSASSVPTAVSSAASPVTAFRQEMVAPVTPSPLALQLDVAGCGNGRLDVGEACDLGKKNSNAPGAFCRNDCSFARCGDGVTDTPQEQCDLGAGNSNAPSADCTTACHRNGQTLAANTVIAPMVLTPLNGFAPQMPQATADLLPLLPHYAAAPQTASSGPGSIAVMAAGAAAGIGWMRKRR